MTMIRSTALLLFLSALPVYGQLELSNGSAQPFPILVDKNVVNGARGYIVNIGPAAKRLEIRMVANVCETDIDLFVSYGSDVTAVSHDYTGQPDSGNTKIVVITPTSSSPLREGTYYIGLQLKNDSNASGTLFVTIDNNSDNALPQTVLASGAPANFSFGCLATIPVLYNGPFSYRVTVPAGATSLVINVTSPTTGARIDVYANAGSDVTGTGASIPQATGPGANKTLTIANPQAGVFFIAMRVVIADVTVAGTISATVGAPAGISVSSNALTFNGTVGNNPPSQTFTVRNTASGTLNFLITKTQSWITLSPDRGSATTAGTTITITINTAGLSSGTFNDTLTVTDQGSPPAPSVSIRVTLILATGPGLTVAPTLDFGTVPVTQPKDLTLTLHNGGTAVLTVNAIPISSAQYTVLSPSVPFSVAAGADQVVTIRFIPASPGPQNATLTITSNVQTATVALTGSGQGPTGPTISASPTSLTFTAQAGSNPPTQTFTVRNGGSGILAYQIATSDSWLSVAPATGSSTGGTNTHTASVNTSTLGTGTFNAQIRITPGTGNALSHDDVFQSGVVVIGVQLTITAGSGPTPTVTAAGIVNAASFVATTLPGGAIARGSIFSIFGVNVGPTTLVSASSFPLQTTLAGVSLKISKGGASADGIPLAVVATQINAIMPSNAPLGDVTLTVTFNGRTSAAVPMKVVDTSIGIFTVTASGMGPGSITNFVSATEQPLNSRSTTARQRQVVIVWVTGVGPITGPDNVPPGAVQPAVTVDVFIGGKQVTNKLYAGRSPQFAGLDQIVVEVPADAPSGCFVPVFMRAGGTTSNVVTMAIDANGSACSDPSNPVGTITQRGGKIGVITLLRAGVRASVAGQTLDITLDAGTASFTSSPGGDFAFNPLTSLPPLGACTAFSAGNIDLSGLLGGQLPSVSVPGVTNLNAGSPLTVTGTGGSRSIPRDAGSGAYFALLGSSFPIPGQPSQPLLLSPGAFTIAGPGGPDVGRFTANLTVPTTAQWTNRNQITSIDRSQGVTLNWTGGDPATQFATIIGANVDTMTNAAGVFVCLAPLAPGTFTVQSPVLSVLPPSNPQQPDQFVGILAFLVGPSGSVPTFTASGLDAGVVFYESIDATTPTYR